MNETLSAWSVLRKLFWKDLFLILGVIVLARLISTVGRWLMSRLSEKLSPYWRLSILRTLPVIRLFIALGVITVIVPMLIEPTFRNVAALFAGVGLALAFELKDYGSSFVAGWVTLLENVYQPGDWIEVDGAYGEVKSIRARPHGSSRPMIRKSSSPIPIFGRPTFLMRRVATEVFYVSPIFICIRTMMLRPLASA